MKTFLLLSFFFACLLLVGCTPTPDVSKLFNSPCPAPCWYGVIPGKTTKDELKNLIPSFPYYEQKNTYWRDVYVESTQEFFMDYADNWGHVRIELKDGIVRSIEIGSNWGQFFSGLNDLGLNLSDIVNLYGYPTTVIVGRGCGGDMGCNNLNLFYYGNGMIAAVETNAGSDVKISTTLPLVKLTFVDPQDLPSFQLLYFDLEPSPLGKNSLNCLIENFSFPWQGYGTIHLKGTLDDCNIW